MLIGFWLDLSSLVMMLSDRMYSVWAKEPSISLVDLIIPGCNNGNTDTSCRITVCGSNNEEISDTKVNKVIWQFSWYLTSIKTWRASRHSVCLSCATYEEPRYSEFLVLINLNIAAFQTSLFKIFIHSAELKMAAYVHHYCCTAENLNVLHNTHF